MSEVQTPFPRPEGEAKPTPGPMFPQDNGREPPFVSDPEGNELPRTFANMAFIADAFTIHHETGLTPRELWENVQSKDHVIMDQGQQIHHLHEQLAEQNRHLAELLEIADAAVRALASDICNLVPDEDLQRWQAAIAKARGGSDA